MHITTILWLTENYPPQRGGMAHSCDRIVDGLRKNGFVIDVLHFSNRGVGYQRVQQLSGTYTAVPFEESESHTLNVTWNYLQHNQYNLLVCFGGYLPVLAAPVYAKWLGIPLLTMIRGNDFDTAIFTPRKRDLLRDVFEASKKVCVVTQEKKEKIERFFPEVDVIHIANGINTEAWKPSDSEILFATHWRRDIAGNKLVVGIFGQLKAKKGVDFFIRVLADMEEKNNFYVLLIGELSDELVDLIKTSAVAYTHFSFMDRYELMRYYLCCDGIAIPSYYDGMPNVLLEAGALAIPVLASNVGGMRDLIADKIDGLLFSPGDRSTCRKTLQLFADSTSVQRKAWGNALQKSIIEKFTDNHEIKNYEKTINSLLDAADDSILRVQSR